MYCSYVSYKTMNILKMKPKNELNLLYEAYLLNACLSKSARDLL